MYDELGGEVPLPDDAMRAAVAKRAAALRLRRRAVMGGSAVASSLVIVLVAAALTSGPRSGAVDVVDIPTPTETATVDPPTPSPTPTATPTPTPTPSPTRSVEPTPSPTPTCTEPQPGYSDACPDGKPGWHSAISAGCAPATAAQLPAGERAAVLFEGVRATFALPAHVAQGTAVNTTVRIQSSRTDEVRLEIYLPGEIEAVVFGAGGGAGRHGSDVSGVPEFRLSPAHPSYDIPVRVLTRACGDTYEDVEPPLATGQYDAGVRFEFKRGRPDPGDGMPTPTPTSTPDYPDGSAAVPADAYFALRVPFEIV